MTDRLAPVMRALVVASLLFATATLMLVAVSTARASSGHGCGQPLPLAGALERSFAA